MKKIFFTLMLLCGLAGSAFANYDNVFTSSFDAETTGAAPSGYSGSATCVVATPGLNSSTKKITCGSGTLTRTFAAWNKIKYTFRFLSGSSTAVRNLRVFANRSGVVPTTSDTSFLLVFEAGGTIVANFDTVGYAVSSAVLQNWTANTEYLVSVTIDAIDKTVVYNINGTDYLRLTQGESSGYNFYRANVSTNTGYIMFDTISSSGGLDDISVDNYVPSTDLELLDPESYRFYQRDANNLGNILISGRYSGSPGAIEARWQGGSWTTIQSSPTEGKFSGTLTNQAIGQGTLDVRVVGNVSLASSTYVSIGDIYIVAGQSNDSGRGTNNQSYSTSGYKAGLFKNNNHWANLTDPFDVSTGENDVNADGTANMGSYIPLLATEYLTNVGVPVAFVPTAIGGKTSAQFQPGSSHTDRTTFYGSMIYRILKLGAGGAKAVMWWQGESDGQASVSEATYFANMQVITAAILSDTGLKTMVAKLQTCSGIADADEAKIRAGHADLWASDPNTIQGPDLVSILATEDGLHAITDAKLQTAADLWYGALATWLSSLDATAPTVSSQTITGNVSTVSLPMSEPVTSSGLTSDWVVTINGISRSVSSTVLTSSTTLTLYVSGAVFVGDTITLSYAGTSIEDNAGNLLAPFGPVSVTNNSAEDNDIIYGNGGSWGAS